MFKRSLLAFAMALVAGQASATVSTPDDRLGLGVTLYQGGYALIQDAREVSLKAGEQSIEFQGVSPQLVHDSALLEGAGVDVRERTFSYDLVSLQSLLKANIGQMVRLQLNSRYFGDTGDDPVIKEARLLALRDGAMIVKVSGEDDAVGQVMALPLTRYGDMVSFASVPDHLSESPTLSMTVASDSKRSIPMNLTYLASGYDWEASYVASFADDESLDLDAWVTLTNNTDLALDNARVQLMAGQLNRVSPRPRPEVLRMAAMDKARAKSEVQPQAVGDYQLYTLPRTVDLAGHQSKQTSLFEADQVAVTKRYELSLDLGHGQKGAKPNVMVELNNETEAGLGMPMPAGVMRFYEADSHGRQQFVGETRLPDLDRHQHFKARLGSSFALGVDNQALESPIRTGQLKGVLTLVNGGSADKTVDLLLQPVVTRANQPGTRTSLCDDGEYGREDRLKLDLDLADTAISIRGVTAESDGVCRLSLAIPGDSRAEVGYRANL